MQKRASFSQKHYTTVFEPLPVGGDRAIYFDAKPILLPYSEDFPKLHYHDRFEIGICESGDGLFLSEGEFYSVTEGDVIFLAPGKRHYSRSLHPQAPCRCRFVYLRANDLWELFKGLDKPTADRLQRLAEAIPAVLHRDTAPAEHLAYVTRICTSADAPINGEVSLRLACFLLEARRHFQPHEDAKPPIKPSRYTTDAATAIAEHIALHYERSETSAELAAMVHISESQLRRQFLHAYGIPPLAYRKHLRCRIARELLSNPRLTVGEIAERVGYPSSSDFCRAFRAEYHISPSEYRKQ